MYQFMMSYIKWNHNFCLPPSWMWALLSTKLKKETFRWPCGQDKITSRFVHVLGFVYGRKQKEMPAHVVVPSSCHQARGTASLCMNTQCVLQEDSSENDEVFKSTLYFPCGKIFVQLQTCTLFHKLHVSMFCHTFHHVRLTNNSGWPGTVRVWNCDQLVASATENWVLATRISRLVASRRLTFSILLMFWAAAQGINFAFDCQHFVLILVE